MRARHPLAVLAESDHCVTGNRFVSAHHCSLELTEGGKTFLVDASTNGTVVNGDQRVKGGKKELGDGDVVYLVKNADSPQADVFFTFRTMEGLAREGILDQTLPYTPMLSPTVMTTTTTTPPPPPLTSQVKPSVLVPLIRDPFHSVSRSGQHTARHR
jgi:pSer/pThr/pTyr-binding forkhead associated (FHA) protein